MKRIPENVIVGQLLSTMVTGSVHLNIDIEKCREFLVRKAKDL